MRDWWTKAPDALDLRLQAWKNFMANPTVAEVSAAVRSHVGRVGVVVDVGCGGGQEMVPYLADGGGVGIDTSHESLTLAHRLLREHNPPARFVLTRASVEALPLRPRCADLVICRLVLQRVDVLCTLTETARILRPGGGLLVTFHHQRYYLRKLRGGWRARDLRPMVYAVRILLSGLWFDFSSRQRRVIGMSEIYLTAAHLRRLAAGVGLDFIAELPGGSAVAPVYLFRRHASRLGQ